MVFSEINFLDGSRPICRSDIVNDEEENRLSPRRSDANDVPSRSTCDITETRATDTMDIDASMFSLSRHFRQSKTTKEMVDSANVSKIDDPDMSRTPPAVMKASRSPGNTRKRKCDDTRTEGRPEEEGPPRTRQKQDLDVLNREQEREADEEKGAGKKKETDEETDESDNEKVSDKKKVSEEKAKEQLDRDRCLCGEMRGCMCTTESARW